VAGAGNVGGGFDSHALPPIFFIYRKAGGRDREAARSRLKACSAAVKRQAER